METTLEGTLGALKSMMDGASMHSDYRSTVGVVGDVGRLLAEPDAAVLGQIASAIASLRERLEYDGLVEHPPSTMLCGDKAGAFAGGALWACADIIDAHQRRRAAGLERRRAHSGRERARQAVLEVASSSSVFTPSDVRAHLAKSDASDDAATVSRAIRDLLEGDQVAAADAPAGSNRQHRYYRLVDGVTYHSTELDDAKEVLQGLSERLDRHTLRSLLEELA